MRGSIKDKSMVSLRTDGPSSSPDQTKIAYKKRLERMTRGMWRLAVLDLQTGQESLLAETRSVNDQAEWLDSNRLLYGLPRPGSEATTSDVWVVPADGTVAHTVFIPEASSPAVVR
jgi:Tol biopolymer transport system component